MSHVTSKNLSCPMLISQKYPTSCHIFFPFHHYPLNSTREMNVHNWVESGELIFTREEHASLSRIMLVFIYKEFLQDSPKSELWNFLSFSQDSHLFTHSQFSPSVKHSLWGTFLEKFLKIAHVSKLWDVNKFPLKLSSGRSWDFPEIHIWIHIPVFSQSDTFYY